MKARGKLVRAARIAMACLLLAACSDQGGNGEEEGLSVADEAKAAAMLADYDAARTAGNPEAAESTAERLRDRYPDSAASKGLESTLAQVSADAQEMREKRRLQGLWNYQVIAVGAGEQRSATVFSRTADLGEDQPAPVSDAQLVLRDHPVWGRSAYLLLAQSKFECGTPCTMQIAFDGSAASEWRGKQADSGKGPALFIEEDARFLRALEGAKSLRIELPKGSGRIPALVFEVGGYDPGRYAKP